MKIRLLFWVINLSQANIDFRTHSPSSCAYKPASTHYANVGFPRAAPHGFGLRPITATMNSQVSVHSQARSLLLIRPRSPCTHVAGNKRRRRSCSASKKNEPLNFRSFENGPRFCARPSLPNSRKCFLPPGHGIVLLELVAIARFHSCTP